jgi:hypothetical protein
MAAMADRRTLYDDWKARREQLARLPYLAGDHHAVEAQVLDYLLRRYQDTPEGAQPARFPLKKDVYVNHRAIVVLHHLGGGRIPTVTTPSEAQARVQSIVRRMLSDGGGHETTGLREAENLKAKSGADALTEQWRMRLCDSNPVTRVLAAVRLGEVGTLDDVGLLSDLLALAPSDDEHPFERAAMVHSMERLAGVVSEPFDVSGVVSSSSPQGEGAASPEQSVDSQPDFVAEILAEIPQATSSEQSVSSQPEIERPDWTCCKCGAVVPGNFQVCWLCGTDVNGVEDPRFRGLDEEGVNYRSVLKTPTLYHAPTLHRMIKKAAIALLILGILVVGIYGWHRYKYPFGMYHRCDKQLWSALHEYAEAHGGKFPSGEATPEASLSLLGRQYAYLLPRRSVPAEVVEQMLARGQLLGPETCGWNYVEGLRLDSNPKLALFWDKEGLDEIGGRLPEGGHFVSRIDWPYEYVPASRWDGFREEQRRLLAEEKAKTQNSKQPQGAAAPHQPGG